MYGSPTRKRHIGWSTRPSIRRLDLGRLTRKHAARIAKRGVRSAKTYVDRKGKKSFAGSKFLKGTASHGLIQENPLFNLSYTFLEIPCSSGCIGSVHFSSSGVSGSQSMYCISNIVANQHVSRDFPSNWPGCPLRTYPPQFGMKLVHLYKRLCFNRTTFYGTKLEPEKLSLGLHLFSTMGWKETDWWDDAEIKSVFSYLCGAKPLLLGSFPVYLPTEI